MISLEIRVPAVAVVVARPHHGLDAREKVSRQASASKESTGEEGRPQVDAVAQAVEEAIRPAAPDGSYSKTFASSLWMQREVRNSFMFTYHGVLFQHLKL